ncbi:UTP--glucose-1-phosphate uridylyltransferase [Candidatus Dependentiae bacterium]|nr:UTP--glucose-1-phosphate uridylyltransferase [Candidatus Dependentiae bacterium]
MDITKLIIPAAGFGTRFLPLTKSVPKEMIPLLSQPAIHYIVEEGIASGIEHFLIVTSRNKQALVNYLDASPELEYFLEEKNKLDCIASIEKILRAAHFTYIRQSEAFGLGHAIWTARHTIGKEYIGICLPDDIIIGKQPALSQLIRIARQEKASVIAVQEVPPHVVSSYGVIAIKKQITPNLFQVSDLIEKPSTKDAPSNLAIIGRYILSHKIFHALNEISDYATDELQLTDGISQMMKNNEKVFAYKVQGTRYDIGTPIGWIKATISLAAQHPEYGPQIKEFLSDFDTLDSFLYNKEKNISHHT